MPINLDLEEHTGEINPDSVLESAKGHCTVVMITGITSDGKEYYASSTGDRCKIVYMLKRAIHLIVSGEV